MFHVEHRGLRANQSAVLACSCRPRHWLIRCWSRIVSNRSSRCARELEYAMKRKEGRLNPPLKDLLNRLKRFFRRRPIEPEDPFAYRMAPLRRPPHKGGAAAVAELDED
jgi:hypothetical protein